MPLNILIAEDSATNRMLFSIVMARTGHKADFAANGLEAAALFARNRYDLVFLDLNMPVMNGVETARKIQKDNGGGVPVYAISGFPAPEFEAAFPEVGIRRCLIKPLDREKLHEIMKECGLKAGEEPRELPAALPARLLRTYAQELVSRAKACEAAVREGNADALYRESHTIRTLGQLLGTRDLVVAAERLEEAAVARDLARCGVLAMETAALCAATAAALKKHLIAS